MIYAVSGHGEASPLPLFPSGVNVHWETESRVTWNAQESLDEEQELVY